MIKQSFLEEWMKLNMLAIFIGIIIYFLMWLAGVDTAFDRRKKAPDVKNTSLPEKEVLSDTLNSIDSVKVIYYHKKQK